MLDKTKMDLWNGREQKKTKTKKDLEGRLFEKKHWKIKNQQQNNESQDADQQENKEPLKNAGNRFLLKTQTKHKLKPNKYKQTTKPWKQNRKGRVRWGGAFMPHLTLNLPNESKQNETINKKRQG